MDPPFLNAPRLVAITDREYPRQLLDIPKPPAALFVLGDVAALSTRQLAVVGSRAATPAGRSNARAFAGAFARAGLTVTSGLAVGIDAAAHEAALAANGPTIAVCGTGLDRIYPTQHAELARQIIARGALVSEYPPGTPPSAGRFSRRNRLISGLSMGLLVVEATESSGSLVTARYATQQGRKVFAIPGSIHLPQSRGPHQLIRQGARLATAPAEVLSDLQIPIQNQMLTNDVMPPAAARALDKRYQMLLDAVGFEPATVDEIASRTGFPGETIVSMLLVLELKGLVAPYPGGQVGRIPK